ncbi:MAG: Ldh family oxidoreductase [Pseudomonadota bacterium]
MLNTTSRPVKIDVLRAFMEDILRAVGFDDETAGTLADIHLESDLRGVYVQGFNHLINTHVQKYMAGKADPSAKPVVAKEGPSYALIDGKRGPGPIAVLKACDVAVEKAKETGTAIVGVYHSHDAFQAGLYAERIARHDLVGMIFSDDNVPVVHPLGGTQPIIGSNPLACAVPSTGDPFLTDFTPCVTLPTYVRYSQRYEAQMDEGLVADADGNPTTDPFQVCTGIGHTLDIGAINPGGSKGYGLLLMIDFLSGALVGADMGLDHITKKDAHKGHLLIAIDPNIFGDAETFKAAVTARMEAIRASKKAPGVDAIRIPGEGSFARRKKALETGEVQIDRLCWDDSLKLAQELGITPPNID